jgi:pyruvate formate-lyase activating enzyme-like uncharacterized protein
MNAVRGTNVLVDVYLNELEGIKMRRCPTGCKLCIQGKKIAIHITYRCTKHCQFCPIPDEKFGNSKIEFIGNEYDSTDDNLQIILNRIIALNSIEGISISGGEPLLSVNYVYRIIRTLKEKRGDDFHIHLYTNGDLLSNEIVANLNELGLDEMRVDSLLPSVYKCLGAARFDVICEVPCIPTEFFFSDICRLIDDSATLKLNGINLNEFEVTKENIAFVKKHNLSFDANRLTDCSVYAQKIIDYAERKNKELNVFFCSYEIADKIRISRNRL